MKKTFKCEVDCANCAAKMEEAVKKISGVENARVNFMTQKFTLEAAEEVFDKVLDEAVKACKKVEPDCEIELA
ncbi:MAG: heavy-metal-associated domain-containing protein [Butyrivibrio sp.]|jgi:cation transport ATPase|uniref:cation transporter n=1 Tax=Butyrivibrio sp. TaxID=28121 RepID=UPI001EC6594D|nr:cation transporter [Butyrivibrio sp.]MBE5842443.1 heavy-metal-associated domain-containing protein [Butyrivibrio sp.]MCR4757613.1 cation transporter [Butyrivibrio sp.]